MDKKNNTDQILYKVWGGQFHYPQSSQPCPNHWSALYFQHTIAHSLSYLTKKYQDGFPQVSLVRALPENLKIIRLEDKRYGDGRISGDEKAAIARNQLREKGIDISSKGKLMEELGGIGVCLGMVDAEEEEVIIPHGLFTRENIKVETVAQFRSHPTDQYKTISYKILDKDWQKVTGQDMYQPTRLAPLILHSLLNP